MDRQTQRNIFLNRELSWLEFNARVLAEAADQTNPLLERLKFIAIFSSNLDEFFMVRVAGLRKLEKLQSGIISDPAGLSPQRQLLAIRNRVDRLLRKQSKILCDELLPALNEYDVRLEHPGALPEAARIELSKLFRDQLLPVLTPLAVDPSHPFPLLNSGAIEIAVSLFAPRGDKEIGHAFVELPEALPRFIPIDTGRGTRSFVPLEEVVMDNLDLLFNGCRIIAACPFRITRDMDFSVEDSGAEDLLLSIERKLLQRRRREPIRLEIARGASSELAAWLQSEFHLDRLYRYNAQKMLHLKQLFELIGKAGHPELLEPPWPPAPAPEFPPGVSMFDAIQRHKEILLALPYQSFDPVVRLLEEAADDPGVLAIKQTLYRVSGDSPVVRNLQRAAENGKQVTVIVELKARFDEYNNITWARLLEESGAHVVYGIADLKIHCKTLLIVRKEGDYIRRYVHLATGNYNDKTARLYTDMGLFSCSGPLVFDVASLFNVMTGFSLPPGEWHKVAASPTDLRRKLIALIDREAANSSARTPGRIVAKMNSLADAEIIRHLDAAAARHVRIDLIVRGICCYRIPKGGTVRVVSIVDRYLEHTRVFYFQNGGNEEYYLSSADWMFRNLDRRIELMFPVEQPEQRRLLADLLAFQLDDRWKGRKMTSYGRYVPMRRGESDREARSQEKTAGYLRKLMEAKTVQLLKLEH
ncbi:MAG: polyphosphate kinase 1 [Victivallaceae bacterium]|nr:polyphosphate kinase 1 [Victivallaceae bacterium]